MSKCVQMVVKSDVPCCIRDDELPLTGAFLIEPLLTMLVYTCLFATLTPSLAMLDCASSRAAQVIMYCRRAAMKRMTRDIRQEADGQCIYVLPLL
jgi:hypothetical protein